jgi:hypothetical protein
MKAMGGVELLKVVVCPGAVPGSAVLMWSRFGFVVYSPYGEWACECLAVLVWCAKLSILTPVAGQAQPTTDRFLVSPRNLISASFTPRLLHPNYQARWHQQTLAMKLD